METASADCAPPGLAMAQLLKLQAKGLISLQEFLDLTKDLAGSDPDRPICFRQFQTVLSYMGAC